MIHLCLYKVLPWYPYGILWKIICTYGIYDICMVYIYKSTGHVLGPTADNPTRNYDTEEIDMAIEKDNVEISSQKVS